MGNRRRSSNIKTRSQVKNTKTKQQSRKINTNYTNMAEPPKIEYLIQHLPPFDGTKENNINFYLKQFDELAEEAKIENKLKLLILKTKFLGKARETLIAKSELNEEQNYENFKIKIKDEFQPKTSFEEAQSNFNKSKQLPNQKIKEFIEKFNSAAQRYIQQSGHAGKDGAKEFLNTVKLTKFLEAIRPDIALEVRKTGPTNFEEAAKTAQIIESALEASQIEEINNIGENQTNKLCENLIEYSKTQTKEIEDLKEEINNMRLQQNEKDSKPKRYCAICETATHDTKFCWYNNKKNKNYARRENFRKDQSYNSKANYLPQQNQYSNMNQRWNYQPPNFGYQNNTSNPNVHNNPNYQGYSNQCCSTQGPNTSQTSYSNQCCANSHNQKTQTNQPRIFQNRENRQSGNFKKGKNSKN